MGMITNKHDNRLTCLCHPSSNARVLKQHGGAQPICMAGEIAGLH